MKTAGKVWGAMTGGTLDLADVDRRHVLTTVRCPAPCSSVLGKVVRAPGGGLIWVTVVHLRRVGDARRRALLADWLRDDDHWRPQRSGAGLRPGADVAVDALGLG